MKSVNRHQYIIASTAIALLISAQVAQSKVLQVEDEEAVVATVEHIVTALSPQTPTTVQPGKPDTQPDVPTLDGLSNDSTYQSAFRGFENWIRDNISTHIADTKHIHGSQATLGDTLQIAKRVLQSYRDHVIKCEKDGGRWDESKHVCRVSGKVTLGFRDLDAATTRGVMNWLRVNNSVRITKTKYDHGSKVKLNDRKEMSRQAWESYEDHVGECMDEYGTWDESTHECWIDGRVDFSFRLLNFSTRGD